MEVFKRLIAVSRLISEINDNMTSILFPRPQVEELATSVILPATRLFAHVTVDVSLLFPIWKYEWMSPNAKKTGS